MKFLNKVCRFDVVGETDTDPKTSNTIPSVRQGKCIEVRDGKMYFWIGRKVEGKNPEIVKPLKP